MSRRKRKREAATPLSIELGKCLHDDAVQAGQRMAADARQAGGLVALADVLHAQMVRIIADIEADPPDEDSLLVETGRLTALKAVTVALCILLPSHVAASN